jgi:hypothetical protein
MSRNGSGTYNLPAGNPVVTGTTITTTWANSTLTDIASALTGSVAADGQTPMTGALNMGTNKVTALATPTVGTDAATKAYVDLTQTASGITGGTITGATLTNDTIDSSPIGNTTRSTVKATTLDLGLSIQSVAIGQGNASIMKNRIINGAMVIDQRNAGASVTIPSTVSQYTLDRFFVQSVNASKYSVQQNAGSVTPPTGFNNYLGITSLAATSSAAGDYYALIQTVEGYNIADLGWGTANAKTVTLSFQVYSSLTGTFGASLRNSANTYSYPISYTISSANTWTQISVTIAGPTSGTWIGTTNGVGISLVFNLGSGSTYLSTAGTWQSGNYYGVTGATSVVGTNGATFYITGVQLEVGSSATGFEYRQYQQELALCQRYFQQLDATCIMYTRWFTGSYPNTGTGSFILPVTMRGTPTFTSSGLTGKNIYNMAADLNINVGTPTLVLDIATTTSARLFIGASTSLGGTSGAPLTITSAGAICSFSAEL